MKKIIIISIAVAALVALLVWAYIASSKPLPGVAQLQPGREHRPQDTKLTYNFNPPTSGDHYDQWITKGVYDTPRPDGNLVHSLEHGYVIIWYDCAVQPTGFSLVKKALAQASTMTAGSEGSPSARLEDMPEAFRSEQCTALKKELEGVYDAMGHHKLIIIPRPSMGKRIVLTAWGYSQEFNSVDRTKMKEFVDAFRDHGPEATNEP